MCNLSCGRVPFVAAFNAINKELHHRMGADQFATFSQVVDKYAQRYPKWSYGPLLKQYAELRNFIIHSPTRPYERLAIPTLQVVQGIEKIRDGFSLHVIPKFARKVTIVTSDNSLAHVLSLVKLHDFSQFPVQHTDGRIQGLLTENGITRWLARHTVAEMPLVDFDDVSVAVVIGEQETQSNYYFVSRNAIVDEVFSLFSAKPLLEAVLVTHSGSPSESLLGIVTRWDVSMQDGA